MYLDNKMLWNHAASIILSVLLLINVTEGLEVKLVQFLFRHGDRAPMNSYPEDPWKNEWPNGLGQLTPLGMQQQYKMGQYLRKRYESLITEYNHKTVRVRSTDVDRTLMSAYANLAGFFPPTGSHVWNKNLTWQPIPVHTVSKKDDYLLRVGSQCQKYKKLIEEQRHSSESEKLNEEFESFFKFLAHNTDLPINDFLSVNGIYDTLLVQQKHNLTWPEWVNDDVMEKLKRIHTYRSMLSVATPELRKLRGGPLVGEMIKNMIESVEYEDKHKIYIYSAHDNTVINLLGALDVLDPHAPPYCSVVMVELLQDDYYNNFVKIFYRNDTTREPYELSLKGCASPCPFEQFKNLSEGIIPKNIVKECTISKQFAILFHEEHTWHSIVTVGLCLGCATLMILLVRYHCYKCSAKKNGYASV